MILPRWLARLNRRITNPVLRRIPTRWSPFTVVHHVGRRTGMQYSTPLVAFPTETGVVFALTYGPGADWVQNVLHAERFSIEVHGVPRSLVRPRLIPRTEAWGHLPRAVRLVLRLLRVGDFLAADDG